MTLMTPVICQIFLILKASLNSCISDITNFVICIQLRYLLPIHTPLKANAFITLTLVYPMCTYLLAAGRRLSTQVFDMSTPQVCHIHCNRSQGLQSIFSHTKGWHLSTNIGWHNRPMSPSMHLHIDRHWTLFRSTLLICLDIGHSF